MRLTHRHRAMIMNIGRRSFNGFAKASFSSAASNEKKVYWRESATVLIAKPVLANSDSKSKNEAEFLITARSEKSKFMPGGLCFPGGNVSHSDSSTEWLDLYKKFGLPEKIKDFRWLEPNARKPEIYQDEDSSASPSPALPKEVSLRITVIRETFEECGILFCRPASGTKKGPPTVELSDSEITKWQKLVKANSGEFLTLCNELKVIPSVQDFYEWNNWLTPIIYKPSKGGQPRRFDTIFYMVLLKDSKPPKVIIDPDEVGSYLWSTASKLLEDHINEIHKLMPPQLYETGRLRGANMEELEKLVKERQTLGIQRWCPYVRMTSDGPMGCLPGDSMMPQDYDIYNYSEMEKLDQTLDELEKSSTKLHRWQIGSDGIYKLLANTHAYGQKYPSDENAKLARSKLYS